MITAAVDYQGQRTGATAHVGPNDRLEAMVMEWYRSRETGEISATGRILAMSQFPFADGTEWTDCEDWLLAFAPWITLVDANADTAEVKEGVSNWGIKWRGLLREFDDQAGAGTYLTAGYGGPLTEEERENWNRLRVTRLSGGDIDLRLGADNLKWDMTASMARGDITAERSTTPGQPAPGTHQRNPGAAGTSPQPRQPAGRISLGQKASPAQRGLGLAEHELRRELLRRLPRAAHGPQGGQPTMMTWQNKGTFGGVG